ncbi:hypothetical protein ARMSODRAFT_1010486 [Armillaria solidipes]|uniref:Uncharacterized protein n=1 Tax=Armillaria solidipes TaxID=1076256 RepID=A0A2H3C469_9AGAR|nr:hypothetical protein ARMSODRAFT_1010486 [Armillaria solidipes]
MAAHLSWFNIPPELVINVDQIGVWVLPNNSYTFHEKGSRQVDVVAKDEKCCYMALTASTASGAFLPFQQVWAEQQKQVAGGIDLGAIKIAMGLPKLHDASIAGLMKLYDFMMGPYGHNMAWEKCIAKEYAIVYEDLGICIGDTHHNTLITVQNVRSENERLILDETEESILEYDDDGTAWKDIENRAVALSDDNKTTKYD